MISKTMKGFLKFPIYTFRMHKAKSATKKLASHKKKTLRAIGNALHKALTNEASGDEKKTISLIEQRRASLLSSNEQIHIIDYGAGSPDSNRTAQEMKRGVEKTAPVSSLCAASTPSFWALVLFHLIRELKPSSCLELGTCVGISAAYQAAALRLNQKGALITLEGAPGISRVAEETFDILGITNASVITGPFHETLPGALTAAKPVDFFFNDGHHDYNAVIQYFNEALPWLADEAVVVFDDISWSPGMRKAWSGIENDKNVAASIDLKKIGIAIFKKNTTTKENLKISLQ